ncbi:hypothetical protein D3C81_1933530 [compost metagenome]
MPQARAQVQRVKVGQGLLDDGTVLAGERRQGRQPGGTAQGNRVVYADRISCVRLLLDQCQGLGNAPAWQLRQGLTQQVDTATARLAQARQQF